WMNSISPLWPGTAAHVLLPSGASSARAQRAMKSAASSAMSSRSSSDRERQWAQSRRRRSCRQYQPSIVRGGVAMVIPPSSIKGGAPSGGQPHAFFYFGDGGACDGPRPLGPRPEHVREAPGVGQQLFPALPHRGEGLDHRVREGRLQLHVAQGAVAVAAPKVFHHFRG